MQYIDGMCHRDESSYVYESDLQKPRFVSNCEKCIQFVMCLFVVMGVCHGLGAAEAQMLDRAVPDISITVYRRMFIRIGSTI